MKYLKNLLFIGVLLGVVAVSYTFAQDPTTGGTGQGFMNREAFTGMAQRFSGNFDGDFRGRGGHGQRGGQFGSPDQMLLTGVANEVGLTVEELRAELESGKTIVDVATAQGVDTETLVAGLLTQAEAKMTERGMDEAQIETMLTRMEADIRTRIEQPWDEFDRPHPPMHGKMEVPMNVVTEQLGVTPQDIFTAVENGQTIADLATEQGIEPDSLVESIVAAIKTHIDTLVADGKLTQEEADADFAEATERTTQFVYETQPPRMEGKGDHGKGGRGGHDGQFEGRGGRPGPNGGKFESIQIVAEQLGYTPATLRTELESGKTIADIATEQGIALETLADAALAPLKTHLAELVTSGNLTQEEADTKLETVKASMIEHFQSGEMAPPPPPPAGEFYN